MQKFKIFDGHNDVLFRLYLKNKKNAFLDFIQGDNEGALEYQHNALDIRLEIEDSQDSYQEAMNKLVDGRGNIIKKVENLKSLGAKTKKSLPQKVLDRASADQDEA